MHLNALADKVSELAARAAQLEGSWKYSNAAGGWFEDKVGYESLMTEVLSVVEHIYGGGHAHYQRIVHWYNRHSLEGLRSIRGILIGISRNIEAGLLLTLESKVAVEISTDFLATAQALADAGDKDPASVLVCCVLEDSVKRLAARHKIEAAKDQEFSVVVNSLLSQRAIEK